MKVYNIQTVSQMSGVSTHCIRAWEKRYGAIKPLRSDNGRRLYSDQELKRLMILGKLSVTGHNIGTIANLPENELEEMLNVQSLYPARETSKSGVLSVEKTTSTSITSPSIYLSNILMALKFYKIDVLTHELNKASLDLNLKQFAFEIIAPLFRSVGEWVKEKKLTIAQEHTISAMTKFIIGKRINHHYESGHKLKLKMIIASPKGELHSLSLLISSLLCAFYHVDFIYLGENLEEEAIADAAKSIQANVVLVGYSSAYESSNNKLLEDSVSKLAKNLNPEAKIWVGGAVEHFKIKSPLYSNVTLLNSFNLLDEKLKEVTSF